jgi:hypothetical protein
VCEPTGESREVESSCCTILLPTIRCAAAHASTRALAGLKLLTDSGSHLQVRIRFYVITVGGCTSEEQVGRDIARGVAAEGREDLEG